MNIKKIVLISEIITNTAIIILISSSFLRDSILSSFFDNIEIMFQRFSDTELLAFLVLIMFIMASILKNLAYEVNKDVPKFTSKFRKLSIDILLFIVAIIALLADIIQLSGIVLSLLSLYYITLLFIEMVISYNYNYNKDIKKDKIF